MDLVEVEPVRPAPFDDLVEPGRVGELQRNELRRVELQVEPRVGRGPDALRHHRALPAAADARENQRVRLEDFRGYVHRARKPGGPPLLGLSLLVDNRLQVFDGDHANLQIY